MAQMSLKYAADGLVTNLPKILSTAGDLSAGSLIEYTNVTRVEPLVLLDESLRLQSFTPDIMSSLVNIFSGYYLQAVAISTSVGNVEVRKFLSKLDPNRTRDYTDLILQGTSKYGGQSVDKLSEHYFEGIDLLMEKIEYTHSKDRREKKGKKSSEQGIGVSRGSIDDFNTDVNLSTGKMINVEIEENGKKVNIPVNIRLIVKYVNPDALVHFLTAIKADRSLRGRVRRWRKGELSFFKDLIWCQDIIDEERKAHFSDKTGLFKSLRARNLSKENTVLDAYTGDVNVATASSIIVMTKETSLQVERALFGKLSNPRVRETLLNLTYTMILLIVDVKWEKVVMYHKSIEEPSILSIRDFKSKSKGTGPDINEILMAYRAGSAPSF